MARQQAKRREELQGAAVPRLLLVAPAAQARALQSALEAPGWSVAPAVHARAAAEAHATVPADLAVVAERRSPRATLALLRELERRLPGVRCIVAGRGGGAEALLDYANRGGAHAVLRPPVTAPELVQAVRRVWTAQQAERAALLQGTGAERAVNALQARTDALAQEIRELRRELRAMAERNRALRTLNESLRVQSTTDPLTGLYNRREFLNRVRTEWGRFRRYGRPLSLIMLDIDHFKRINDTHGHECGDVVLRELGQLISRNKRAQDLTCRYGGEEFVVLLTETTLDAAFHVAEGLRRLVGEHPFDYEGQRIQVHVSLGVCGAMEQDPTDVETFINMADKAMYRAKREGRNRTVVLDARDESRIARQSRSGPPPRRGPPSGEGPPSRSGPPATPGAPRRKPTGKPRTGKPRTGKREG